MSNWVKKLYWQGCALTLGAEALGLPWAARLAVVICAMQMAHALALHRHFLSLPVQVRVAFFLLLVVGNAGPALPWLHALQFAGVNLLLVSENCVLARLLTLLPWNRSVPLSPSLVRAVFMLPPAPGSVAERLGIAPGSVR